KKELEFFLDCLTEEIFEIIDQDYNSFIQFSSHLDGIKKQLTKVQSDFPTLWNNFEKFHKFLCQLLEQVKLQYTRKLHAKLIKKHALMLIKVNDGIQNLQASLQESHQSQQVDITLSERYKTLASMLKSVQWKD